MQIVNINFEGLTDTQQMMYAFGDSRRPNLESAKMVEQVEFDVMTLKN